MASGLESEFATLHEIVKAAKIRLSPNIWDYLIGGTETETTLRRNRMALDSIAFKPRVLRNVSTIDPSSEIFGRKIRLPVMLARLSVRAIEFVFFHIPIRSVGFCRNPIAVAWRPRAAERLKKSCRTARSVGELGGSPAQPFMIFGSSTLRA